MHGKYRSFKIPKISPGITKDGDIFVHFVPRYVSCPMRARLKESAGKNIRGRVTNFFFTPVELW